MAYNDNENEDDESPDFVQWAEDDEDSNDEGEIVYLEDHDTKDLQRSLSNNCLIH